MKMDDDDTAYINEHAKSEASKNIKNTTPKLEESSKSFFFRPASLSSQNLTENIRYPFPIIMVQWKITLSKRIPNLGDTAIFH